MKSIIAIIWITGLLIHGATVAADEPDRCSRVAHLPDESWVRDCDCRAEIETHHETSAPTGMHLVAVCGFNRREDGSELGTYFFRGSSIVRGVVRYHVDDSWSGLDLSFSSEQWGEFTIGYKLHDAAIKALRIPKYSKQTPCWEGVVTVKLTQLVVFFGHDTDGDGSFPLDFDVLSIGEYVPCKSFP